jgi:hypothetical protein
MGIFLGRHLFCGPNGEYGGSRWLQEAPVALEKALIKKYRITRKRAESSRRDRVAGRAEDQPQRIRISEDGGTNIV